MIGNHYKICVDGEIRIVRQTNRARAKRVFAQGDEIFILPQGEINRHNYGDNISAIRVRRRGLEMHLNNLDKMIEMTLRRSTRKLNYFEIIPISYQ